jgi:hypothetical protein
MSSNYLSLQEKNVKLLKEVDATSKDPWVAQAGCAPQPRQE